MWGGVASDTPISFTISYQCEKLQSKNALTLIIPLCSAGSSPKDCTLQDEGEYIYEPLAVRWTKNCFKDSTESEGVGILLLKCTIFLICSICFGGCFYNSLVVGARGVEAIPYIDVIRDALYHTSNCFGPGLPRLYKKYDDDLDVRTTSI